LGNGAKPAKGEPKEKLPDERGSFVMRCEAIASPDRSVRMNSDRVLAALVCGCLAPADKAHDGIHDESENDTFKDGT